jgi:hypothetical protein
MNWTSYDSWHPLCTNPLDLNDEYATNIDPTLTVWNDFLIVSGIEGRVSSWDGNAWKFYDGSGTGTGPYYDGLFPNSNIEDSTSYGQYLVFSNSSSYGISSWDGTNWKHYDGTGTGTGPYHNNFNKAKILEWNGCLLVSHQRNFSSYDGTNWKLYDGTGTGTGPYYDFTPFYQSNSLNKITKFKDGFCISGPYGINSYDGTNWKFQDGTGSGDISYPYYENQVSSITISLLFNIDDKFYMFLSKSHEFDVFEYKNGVWDSNNL